MEFINDEIIHIYTIVETSFSAATLDIIHLQLDVCIDKLFARI